MPDGSKELVPLVNDWIDDGVELIVTSGGTGLGQRDLTIKVLDGMFDSKLPGIEQALHAYGRDKVKTAMLSRLTAGVVRDAIVICLWKQGRCKGCIECIDTYHISFISYDEKVKNIDGISHTILLFLFHSYTRL